MGRKPTEKEKNLHAGHRERVKERFLRESLENFEDHNILELLLFFGVPQKDTNPLAHRLLEAFGSFPAVFQADFDRLVAVEGMTRNAACLVKLIPQISRKYLERADLANDHLNTSDKIGQFLITRFLGRSEEVVYLICLNNACKMLHCELVSTGGLSQAAVDVRKIVETAFRYKAVNLVLAHNHPQGLARPSSQDVRITETLYAVLKPLGLELLDHFVVAGQEYISMMELGYLGIREEGTQYI